MAIKTVALIGATGALGSTVLSALETNFEVTVITRESSTATFPADLRVIRVPDEYPIHPLEAAFAGQDAVVCTVSASSAIHQITIIDAAIRAGVRRFIPAEFGLETLNPAALEAIPALRDKVKVMRRLQDAVQTAPENTFSWTAIGTGIFFDWGLRNNFLHFELKNHKAVILGDGNNRFSATSLGFIGESVAKVLQNEGTTRNKFLFIQSVCTTQNEVLSELERQTKTSWEVVHVDEADFIKKSLEQFESGDVQGLYNRIFAYGVLNSRYDDREDFANELLGLRSAGLEAEITHVLAK